MAERFFPFFNSSHCLSLCSLFLFFLTCAIDACRCQQEVQAAAPVTQGLSNLIKPHFLNLNKLVAPQMWLLSLRLSMIVRTREG